MNFIKEKCQICEKEIMHKNMKGHMNTHSKKIETEVGFVSFKTNENNKFSSDKCHLAYASNFTLKRHMHKLHMGSSDDIACYFGSY